MEIELIQDGKVVDYNKYQEVIENVKESLFRRNMDKNEVAKLTGNIPFEEATLLKLNCDKALAYLDWHSTLHYETCVRFIADWYKAFYIEYGKDMYALTVSQIEEYVQAARKQKLKWAE